MKTNNLVLASRSSYRKALLEKLHLSFICADPDINEASKEDESPIKLARRLAEEKATALAPDFPQHLIIAADQVAILEHAQLKKPGTASNAIQQLQISSGKSVTFYTSVCVLNSATTELKTALDICTVHFKKLSIEQIVNYIELEQPLDCAGSFKSEGLGIALFERIDGDDPNALIGLPLIKLISLLEAFNVPVLAYK